MKTYSCDEIRELISEYADGEAGAEERAAVESHIAFCADCRDELRSIVSLRETVAGAAVEPPPELHGRIMSAVRAERAAKRAANATLRAGSAAVRRRGRTRVLAVAAMLVLAVGAVAIWQLVRGGFAVSDAFGGDNMAPEAAPPGGAMDNNNPYADGVQNGANSPGEGLFNGANSGSADEIFAEYGKGYDGAYLVPVPDAKTAEKLADDLGADLFDGAAAAFVIPFSDEAIGKLNEYGVSHAGYTDGTMCIIVYVKDSADGGGTERGGA